MTAVGDLLVEFTERAEDRAGIEVLTLTERNGFVRQAERFNKRLATENTSKYKVVRRNDIAFNPYLLWAGAVAQNTIIEQGIISPLYPTFRVRDGFDPRYVARLLLSPQMIGSYDGIAFGSVPRRRRSSVTDFLALPVPSQPPIEEQRRIASILDHARQLVDLRRRTVGLSDGLVGAAFGRIFGWDQAATHTLSDFAEVSSGITKGRRLPEGTPTFEAPYLAVSNVKDRHLNLDVMKTMDVTEAERSRFRVRRGDLLMTEGGDPDKLGRGTLWNDELPEVLHQNHIFRVRLHDPSPISPIYLSWFTASRRARSYFLRCAKQTTGIASINKTQLSALPVAVPSTQAQKEFADIEARAQAMVIRAKSGLRESEGLFNALQARAFSGRL